jgi:hypothetical protein
LGAKLLLSQVPKQQLVYNNSSAQVFVGYASRGVVSACYCISGDKVACVLETALPQTSYRLLLAHVLLSAFVQDNQHASVLHDDCGACVVYLLCWYLSIAVMREG